MVFVASLASRTPSARPLTQELDHRQMYSDQVAREMVVVGFVRDDSDGASSVRRTILDQNIRYSTLT